MPETSTSPSSSTEEEVPDGPLAVFGLPSFRRFLSARFTTTLSFQMQQLVVSWQVYDITRDPLTLGLIGLAEFLPAAFVLLPAGHMVDRVSRRRVVLAAVAVLALSTLALLVIGTQRETLYAQRTVWPYYVVILFTGMARGTLGPAFFGWMGELVPRSLYARSSAWMSTVWQSAAVIGPALGGLLLGLLGVQTTLNVCLVGLVSAWALFASLRATPPPPPTATSESFWASLREGVRFVWRTPELLGALTLDLFAVLFGGAIALLPAFAAEVLFVGPQGLGLLRAAPSIGSVPSALVLALRRPIRRAGRVLLICVAGFGLCMIAFALSTQFWVSFAVLVLSGGFDSVSVVIRSQVLQLFTPDALRGRVAAVNYLFIGSSNELGALESGLAAKLLGLVPSVIVGGCVTLAVVGGAAFSRPLRSLNLLRQSEARSAAE